MDEKTYKDRTKKLALGVMPLVEDLPRTRSSDVIARQILRSATSIGANYRAACRAKSAADMIVKLKIVEEECAPPRRGDCHARLEGSLAMTKPERQEILAMTVASIKTLRARNPKQ
jgi:hypothetical protein